MVIQRIAPRTMTMIGNDGPWIGQQAVEPLLPCEALRAVLANDAAAGDARGLAVDRFGDAIVEVLRQLPAQLLGVAQDLFGGLHVEDGYMPGADMNQAGW